MVGVAHCHSVDSRYSNVLLRQGETQYRVAQKQETNVLIAQTVKIELIALCLPDDIAKTQRYAIIITLQEHRDKGLRLEIVLWPVGRTTSREKCYTTSIGVQEQLLTSRNQQGIVVFGELTSGSIDKRHLVIIAERGNVGIGEHALARQSPDTAMTNIKEGQHTLVKSTLQIGVGSWVHRST